MKTLDEIHEWILDPDATYTIESKEEYDLIIERLVRLWDIVEDANNLEDPIAMELNKLSDGANKWEDEHEQETLDKS